MDSRFFMIVSPHNGEFFTSNSSDFIFLPVNDAGRAFIVGFTFFHKSLDCELLINIGHKSRGSRKAGILILICMINIEENRNQTHPSLLDCSDKGRASFIRRSSLETIYSSSKGGHVFEHVVGRCKRHACKVRRSFLGDF